MLQHPAEAETCGGALAERVRSLGAGLVTLTGSGWNHHRTRRWRGRSASAQSSPNGRKGPLRCVGASRLLPGIARAGRGRRRDDRWIYPRDDWRGPRRRGGSGGRRCHHRLKRRPPAARRPLFRVGHCHTPDVSGRVLSYVRPGGARGQAGIAKLAGRDRRDGKVGKIGRKIGTMGKMGKMGGSRLGCWRVWVG